MKSISKVFLGLACITISLGILIVILAYSIGGNSVHTYSDYTYELDDTVEDVIALDFDLSYADVKIVSGDNFNVSIENMPKDGYKSYVSNGTWVIKEDFDNVNRIKLFGIDLPVSTNWFGFQYNDFKSSKITITIPEDFHGNEIEIELGAGVLYAEKISGDNVEFSVGAGTMEVDEVKAINYVGFENGAGNLTVHDMEATDVNVEGGVGEIKISGSIKRDCTVETGVGSVFLDINGNEENYNYSVDCGIGHVIINDKDYKGITDKTIRNNNSVGEFRLECGIGKIELYVR